MKNICFIFGAPRSGTTWLWKMISLHPDVIAFHRPNSSESGIYHTSSSPKQDILDFAAQHPNKLLLEKTPLHCFHYKKILEDFPESKNIILYRHPIAIINSMLKSNMDAFKNFTTERATKLYNQYNKALKTMSGLNIYYENLMESHSWLYIIFDFLGLEFTEDMVMDIYNSTFQKQLVNVDGAFRKGSVNGWQTELTKTELLTIRSLLK